MENKLPEFVAFAGMEIVIAPGELIAIRPLLNTELGTKPGMPFHIVLTQEQVKELVSHLQEAAVESVEYAKQKRS
jgi:hypothetical protein